MLQKTVCCWWVCTEPVFGTKGFKEINLSVSAIVKRSRAVQRDDAKNDRPSLCRNVESARENSMNLKLGMQQKERSGKFEKPEKFLIDS